VDELAGLAVELLHRPIAGEPDDAVWPDGEVAESWDVRRFGARDRNFRERLAGRIEPHEIVRPVLRGPDDVVLVDCNAVRAGKRAGRRGRHLVLGHDARARIELADERRAV